MENPWKVPPKRTKTVLIAEECNVSVEEVRRQLKNEVYVYFVYSQAQRRYYQRKVDSRNTLLNYNYSSENESKDFDDEVSSDSMIDLMMENVLNEAEPWYQF